MTNCEYNPHCTNVATKSLSTPSGELLVCLDHYTKLSNGDLDIPPNRPSDGRPNDQRTPPGAR